MFQIKEYPRFMYPHIHKNKCSDKTIIEYSVDESMYFFDRILNAFIVITGNLSSKLYFSPDKTEFYRRKVTCQTYRSEQTASYLSCLKNNLLCHNPICHVIIKYKHNQVFQLNHINAILQSNYVLIAHP